MGCGLRVRRESRGIEGRMRRIVDGAAGGVDERRGHQDQQTAHLILGTFLAEEPADERDIS